MITSKSKILVVAAHPDDEVLGCGGTIAKLTKLGCTVNILILSEGITSRDPQRCVQSRTSELSELAGVAAAAAKTLGAASVEFGDFPDNRMDGAELLDIVKAIEISVEKHSPTIVFTHHSGDLNVDHRLVSQAVVTAARPLPGGTVETILFFEVASSTECQIQSAGTAFLPDWFEDISDTLEMKLKALELYNSEMRPFPHPRSLEAIKHLAGWRGATVGKIAVEAFKLARHVS